jgi:hypothetical protein
MASKTKLEGSGVSDVPPEELDERVAVVPPEDFDEGVDDLPPEDLDDVDDPVDECESAATDSSASLWASPSAASCPSLARPASSICLLATVSSNGMNITGPTTAPKESPETPQLTATATHKKNRLSIFDLLNAAFLFSAAFFSSGRRISEIVIGCK